MIRIKATNKQDFSLREISKTISKPNSFFYFQNKKGLEAWSSEITSLVKVPVQNINTYSIIKTSSIASLLDYSEKIKILAKEKGIIKYKNVVNHSLKTNNAIIQYLKVNSSSSSIITSDLIEKKNKILDIKHNTQSFIIFNSSLLYYNYFTLKKKIRYSLDKVISKILKGNLSKNDKKFFNKLLNKLIKIKKLNSKKLKSKVQYNLNSKLKTKLKLKRKVQFKNKLNSKNLRFNNKTLVYSLRLKNLLKINNNKSFPELNGKILNLSASNLNKSTLFNQKGDTRNVISQRIYFSNAKYNLLLKNKSLIEDYFKLRHKGSIDQYKDTHSLNYKKLSIEHKKLIDALIFIDSYSIYFSNSVVSSILPKNKDLTITVKPNLIMSKTSFIKSISPFNSHLAKSSNIMYFFNKQNNYNIFKNEHNIGDILEAAFLSMQSFISKAYFSVKPKSILINLFFFWFVDVDKSLFYFFLKKKNNQRNNLKKKMINFNTIKKVKRDRRFRWNFKSINNYLLNRKGFLSGRKKRKLLKLEVKRIMRFSKKFSVFAIIFEKKIKRLTWVLSKLLKKRVNFQFTRIYYPHNDSNILLFMVGFLGFLVKFNSIIYNIIKNVNFRIRKKRLLRLKYRNIPSVVTGLNLKLAGRISKTRSNKRVKTSKWQIGNLHRNINNLTVNNHFTNKRSGGVFNISIKHNATILK